MRSAVLPIRASRSLFRICVVDQVNTLRTAGPLLGRAFWSSTLTSTLTRRDGDGDSPDTKGRFGLNTLHEPAANAVADLVFVYGLGGGSRST